MLSKRWEWVDLILVWFHRKFAEIIRKDMRIICTDPYASHVLEKIMHICLETVSSNDAKHPQEHLDFCLEWLCSICRYAFNNVEDFISDIYASHILRSSLQCLSGVQVEVGTMKSRRSRRHLDDKESDNAVGKFKSEEFIDILRDFGERFVAWPQLLGNDPKLNNFSFVSHKLIDLIFFPV